MAASSLKSELAVRSAVQGLPLIILGSLTFIPGAHALLRAFSTLLLLITLRLSTTKADQRRRNSSVPRRFVAGFYYSRIAYYAWKRVPGFSYGDIPYYE